MCCKNVVEHNSYKNMMEGKYIFERFEQNGLIYLIPSFNFKG